MDASINNSGDSSTASALPSRWLHRAPWLGRMYTASTDRLAAILLAQQRVIAQWQVVGSGCDPELPVREVAAGRWRRLARRTYLAADAEPTLLQRAWCAQLLGGPHCVVSGALAGQLLGIADCPSVTAVVLVPAACQRKGVKDYVVRRTGRRPAYTDRDGLRIAPATRAVIDAARSSPDLRAVRALVCGAINGKHTSYDELVTERAAEPRAGLGRLGRALQDWADGARSAPEAEVADELRRLAWAGTLPRFLLNPAVYDGAVLVGSPDVYVPGRSLGAETDSRRHHGAVDDGEATVARHVTFADYGLRLEHVSPRRFRQGPAVWAAQFAAVAEQRLGIGDPSGLRIEPVGPLQPVRGRRRPR